jgi:hypothetical protein
LPGDALNIEPTQYGLHSMLPDEPNEILASFKPWLQVCMPFFVICEICRFYHLISLTCLTGIVVHVF